MSEIPNQILAGVACTVISALVIYFFSSYVRDYIDSKKIYYWLIDNSDQASGNTFRSTREIASHCNLTEDRVHILCSKHKKIFLSTGKNEGSWSIHARKPKGFFDS
jgi:hypothetical protein